MSSSIGGSGSVQASSGFFMVDGQEMDFGQLVMTLQLDMTNHLDCQIADQMSEIKDRNEALKGRNDLLSQLRALKAGGSTVENGEPIEVDGNTIDLGNGYSLEVNPNESGTTHSDWKIIGPDGEETTIWGDPHVKEDDGGNYEFKGDSTFVLPDGTKITATTVPYNGSNDHTLTGSLTITRGDQRVSVSDVNTESPTISDVKMDGRTVDANTNDGYIFTTVEGRANDWALNGSEVDANATSIEEDVATNTSYQNELKGFMTESMRKELESLDIPVPNNIYNDDGSLNEDAVDGLIDSVKGNIDSLNSESQLDMIRMQSLMDKRNQRYEQTSNTLEKDQKTRDSIVGNTR
jgi:hypothetical protein